MLFSRTIVLLLDCVNETELVGKNEAVTIAYTCVFTFPALVSAKEKVSLLFEVVQGAYKAYDTCDFMWLLGLKALRMH